MSLKINIAVVDDGGHLLAFERVDGARPASAYTAITKATSAATFRQPTGPQPPNAASPDPLLSLSLQNAAQASGGKITALYGGVPVVVDDQVIGGVGSAAAPANKTPRSPAPASSPSWISSRKSNTRRKPRTRPKKASDQLEPRIEHG